MLRTPHDGLVRRVHTELLLEQRHVFRQHGHLCTTQRQHGTHEARRDWGRVSDCVSAAAPPRTHGGKPMGDVGFREDAGPGWVALSEHPECVLHGAPLQLLRNACTGFLQQVWVDPHTTERGVWATRRQADTSSPANTTVSKGQLRGYTRTDPQAQAQTQPRSSNSNNTRTQPSHTAKPHSQAT